MDIAFPFDERVFTIIHHQNYHSLHENNYNIRMNEYGNDLKITFLNLNNNL